MWGIYNMTSDNWFIGLSQLGTNFFYYKSLQSDNTKTIPNKVNITLMYQKRPGSLTRKDTSYIQVLLSLLCYSLLKSLSMRPN